MLRVLCELADTHKQTCTPAHRPSPPPAVGEMWWFRWHSGCVCVPLREQAVPFFLFFGLRDHVLFLPAAEPNGRRARVLSRPLNRCVRSPLAAHTQIKNLENPEETVHRSSVFHELLHGSTRRRCRRRRCAEMKLLNPRAHSPGPTHKNAALGFVCGGCLLDFGVRVGRGGGGGGLIDAL